MHSSTLSTFALILMIALISSTSSAAPVVELQAKNVRLRKALAIVTMKQARDLGMLAHVYAKKHARFPAKPSDLKDVIQESEKHDLSVLFAPYETAPEKPSIQPKDESDLWKQLDEHSSFLFHGGKPGDDPMEVLIEERKPILPGHVVTVYRDGHVELRKTKDAEAPAQAQQPINAMLAAMAKGDGISESEAKTVALEVYKRLWGSDPLLKVTECKLDDRKHTWIVGLNADNGLERWGCRVWINKAGHLEKTEYLD